MTNLQIANTKIGKFLASLLSLVILVTNIVPIHAAPLQPQTWAQFVITKIECLEQTNDGIGAPGDEIAMGGTATNKDGIDKIPYQDLGSFTTDTKKSYNWIFTEIPLTETSDYARVSLSLVEMDFGGKEEHLEALAQNEYELVRNRMILEFLARLDELTAGTTDGSAVSSQTTTVSFGAILGAALTIAAEEAAATILGELWDYLLGLLSDDAFQPQFVAAPTAQLFAQVQSGSSTRQPLAEQLIFEEFGGKYRITYEWRQVEKTEAASRKADYEPYLSLTTEVAELRKLYEQTVNQPYKLYLPVIQKVQ